MIDVQNLLNRVNLSVRKNLGKEIIALLLVFLSSVILAPLALVFASAGSELLSLVFLLLMPILLFMLQISFAQMCGKIYRAEPCVLGNLLDSFRDWRRCGVLALAYAVGSVVISVATVLGGMAVGYLASGAEAADFYGEDVLASMISFMPVVVMVCMALFFLLVLLPTAFTHLVLMDNEGMPLLSAVQENFRLLKGKRLPLVKFLLRVGRLWLVGAVLALAASFVLVSAMLRQTELAQSSLTALHLASQICDMVYYICVYTSLIRLVTGVAAYYQAIREEEAGMQAPFQIHQAPSTEDRSSTEEV